MDSKRAAERNIKLFPILMVLSKRTHLPVLAVFYVSIIGMSVGQLAALASFFAFIGLLLEIPSGYFSDRIGRRESIILMGLFTSLSMTVLILMPNLTGVYLSTVLDSLGFAFLSGSKQALLHDSLEELKRPKDYTKILSRSQSISLIGNALLVAGVSATYAIDPNVPFAISGFLFAGLSILALSFTNIYKTKPTKPKKVRILSIFKYRQYIFFAIIFGTVSALYTSPNLFRDAAIFEYGLRPELIGTIYGSASILGALLGIGIHKLRELPLRFYIILDSLILISSFVGYAFGSIPLALVSAVTSFSFWRYRQIIYEDHLLNKYKTRFKATMISGLRNVENLQRIWLPGLLGIVLGVNGYQDGFLIMAIVASVILIPFYFSTRRILG